MIPLPEARAHVLERCGRLDRVKLELAEAHGLVAAAGVVATEAVPPFDNTAMDGYAVRAADTAGAPVCLEVVGELAAGSAPNLQVGEGQAIRIMTGAAMPLGADAVVKVESTSLRSAGQVEIAEEVTPGTHVRRAGEDISPGDEVLAAGTLLLAGQIGLLASLGVEAVEVFRRPRVGVISTGDELVVPPQPLGPGQIRDSNRPALLALVTEAGAEAVDLGRIGDDEQAITEALRAGTETCDVVISSGGVSMGEYDLVKVVLDRLGEMRWMQVAIKPAKRLAFGTVGDVPVFGLPGNPVSSMVSFELFARPALRKMMGHVEPDRLKVRAIVDEDLRRRPDGKVHFVRVLCSYGDDGRIHVRSAGGQGSHQLSAMARAGGLAVLDDGDGVAAGGEVEVMLLGP